MSTENLKSKTSEKPLVFGVRTYTKYEICRPARGFQKPFGNLQEVLERFSVPGGFSAYIFDVSAMLFFTRALLRLQI